MFSRYDRIDFGNNIVRALKDHKPYLRFKREVGSYNDGEYHCPCPKCGGDDRFMLWPDHPEWKHKGGRYYCRQCNITGDGIQFLRDFCGMSFRQACEYLKIDPDSLLTRTRAVADEEDEDEDEDDEEVDPEVKRWRRRLKTIRTTEEAWQIKTEEFVAKCEKELTPEAFAYYASRGLSAETVAKYRLGYNPQSRWEMWEGIYFEDRTDDVAAVAATVIGEAPHSGVWQFLLSAGYVIPTFRFADVVCIRIRTTNPKLKKYVNVRGSQNAASYFPGTQPAEGMPKKPVIIVESVLDGMMIEEKAGDLVDCVALGSSATKPDAYIDEIISNSLYASVVLDSDEAGMKATAWWLRIYSHAEAGCVPDGKDPGEYFALGGDIREWVMALMPDWVFLPPEEAKAMSDSLKPKMAENKPGLTAIGERAPICEFGECIHWMRDPNPVCNITRESVGFMEICPIGNVRKEKPRERMGRSRRKRS